MWIDLDEDQYFHLYPTTKHTDAATIPNTK